MFISSLLLTITYNSAWLEALSNPKLSEVYSSNHTEGLSKFNYLKVMSLIPLKERIVLETNKDAFQQVLKEKLEYADLYSISDKRKSQTDMDDFFDLLIAYATVTLMITADEFLTGTLKDKLNDVEEEFEAQEIVCEIFLDFLKSWDKDNFKMFARHCWRVLERGDKPNEDISDYANAYFGRIMGQSFKRWIVKREFYSDDDFHCDALVDYEGSKGRVILSIEQSHPNLQPKITSKEDSLYIN